MRKPPKPQCWHQCQLFPSTTFVLDVPGAGCCAFHACFGIHCVILSPLRHLLFWLFSLVESLFLLDVLLWNCFTAAETCFCTSKLSSAFIYIPAGGVSMSLFPFGSPMFGYTQHCVLGIGFLHQHLN